LQKDLAGGGEFPYERGAVLRKIDAFPWEERSSKKKKKEKLAVPEKTLPGVAKKEGKFMI